jgi:hypothetical protein
MDLAVLQKEVIPTKTETTELGLKLSTGVLRKCPGIYRKKALVKALSWLSKLCFRSRGPFRPPILGETRLKPPIFGGLGAYSRRLTSDLLSYK